MVFMQNVTLPMQKQYKNIIKLAKENSNLEDIDIVMIVLFKFIIIIIVFDQSLSHEFLL